MSMAANSLAPARFFAQPPNPGQTIIETSDPLVVNSRFAQEFAPHHLEVTGRSRSFRTVAHKAPMSNATMYHAFSSADVRIVTRPIGDNFIFYLPLQGRITIARQTGAVDVRPGQIGIINPQERYSLWKLNNCKQLTLKICRRDIEEEARQLLPWFPSGVLEFDAKVPVNFADCPLLIDILQAVYADIFTGKGTFLDPSCCAPMEALLARLLLRELESNFSSYSESAPCQGGPAPYYVTRVEHAVAADPGRDWTIAEMVEIAGASARSLYAGFRRYRGTSPTRFLKNIRLQGVHRELQDRSLGLGRQRTLTEIAADWGFRHMSDFAKDYRLRFGESPSHTLRKCGN